MGTENLTTKNTSEPAVASEPAADTIDAQTFIDMLDILDDLTDHTHIFYDDYSSACNCNCVCNCTRGIV